MKKEARPPFFAPFTESDGFVKLKPESPKNFVVKTHGFPLQIFLTNPLTDVDGTFIE